MPPVRSPAPWPSKSSGRKSGTRTGSNPRHRLDEAFQKVNRLIFERAARDPAFAGMGTTLTAAVGKGERMAVGNVGDSRAYLFRDGDLRQLTEDHSWAWEQRRRKLLSEQEIRRSPFRSMITRSLGYVEAVQVDLFDVHPEADDLLFSARTDCMRSFPEKKIVKILPKQAEPGTACRALIEAAKKEGGDDNITVVLALFKDAKNGATVRLVRYRPDSALPGHHERLPTAVGLGPSFRRPGAFPSHPSFPGPANGRARAACFHPAGRRRRPSRNPCLSFHHRPIGASVIGLTDREISVACDGAPQPVDSLRSVLQGGESMAVVLLFDRSGSISRRDQPAREAAAGFIRRLTDDDEIGIVTFDERISLDHPLDKGPGRGRHGGPGDPRGQQYRSLRRDRRRVWPRSRKLRPNAWP